MILKNDEKKPYKSMYGQISIVILRIVLRVLRLLRTAKSEYLISVYSIDLDIITTLKVVEFPGFNIAVF